MSMPCTCYNQSLLLVFLSMSVKVMLSSCGCHQRALERPKGRSLRCPDPLLSWTDRTNRRQEEQKEHHSSYLAFFKVLGHANCPVSLAISAVKNSRRVWDRRDVERAELRRDQIMLDLKTVFFILLRVRLARLPYFVAFRSLDAP